MGHRGSFQGQLGVHAKLIMGGPLGASGSSENQCKFDETRLRKNKLLIIQELPIRMFVVRLSTFIIPKNLTDLHSFSLLWERRRRGRQHPAAIEDLRGAQTQHFR